MSDEEYHATPCPMGRLTWSQGGQTATLPRTAQTTDNKSPDTLFGRAVHAKVLGTEIVDLATACAPLARATRAPPEGKTPLSAAAAANADQVAEAVSS